MHRKRWETSISNSKRNSNWKASMTNRKRRQKPKELKKTSKSSRSSNATLKKPLNSTTIRMFSKKE
jgi:hypothetical protein